MSKFIGLDVGTSTIILAKENNKKIDFYKVRDCFLDLESSIIVKNTLKSLKINYIEDKEKKKIYLVGDSALQLANMFNHEVRRPMFKGVISSKDADAIPMMREIFRIIFSEAEVPLDSIIKYTIPATPLNENFDIEYHKSVIERILADLGYTKFSPVNEGLCVNYAELEDKQFSGISWSCGAGMHNISVAQFGIEAISYAIVGSGDQIDEKVAKTQAKLTASKVTAIKESGIDISNPKGTIEEAISVYYKAMIKFCLQTTLDKMANADGITLKEDIPFAIAGGTSLVGGFKYVFEETLKELAPQYSFTYGDVKFAEDAQNTIAKGALKAAKMDDEN